jgi:hypothetical protein
LILSKEKFLQKICRLLEIKKTGKFARMSDKNKGMTINDLNETYTSSVEI